MNVPFAKLLGSAACNGMLAGQIVFSVAFVSGCELPNWLAGPRQMDACLQRWMTVSALFFPSALKPMEPQPLDDRRRKLFGNQPSAK